MESDSDNNSESENSSVSNEDESSSHPIKRRRMMADDIMNRSGPLTRGRLNDILMLEDSVQYNDDYPPSSPGENTDHPDNVSCLEGNNDEDEDNDDEQDEENEEIEDEAVENEEIEDEAVENEEIEDEAVENEEIEDEAEENEEIEEDEEIDDEEGEEIEEIDDDDEEGEEIEEIDDDDEEGEEIEEIDDDEEEGKEIEGNGNDEQHDDEYDSSDADSPNSSDSDSTSDIFGEAAEEEKADLKSELKNLDKQCQYIQEWLCHEKLAKTHSTIGDVRAEKGEEYLRHLGALHKQLKLKLDVAATKRDLRFQSNEIAYDAEKLAISQNLKNETEKLRDKIRTDIENAIHQLEIDRDSEFTTDEYVDSSSDSRSKMGSTKAGEKPKKAVTVTGPYIVYMLREVDILEDWNLLKKALGNSKKKLNGGSVPASLRSS